MLSLSDNTWAYFIEAFKFLLRYLYDFMNIYNSNFEQIETQIYPTELQLNKAKYFDTESPFRTCTCP